MTQGRYKEAYECVKRIAKMNGKPVPADLMLQLQVSKVKFLKFHLIEMNFFRELAPSKQNQKQLNRQTQRGT